MPTREWEEWKVFMRDEPVGEERMDWRLAVLSSLFANANRGRTTEPCSASDFVYLPELAEERVSEVNEHSLRSIAMAWGAV